MNLKILCTTIILPTWAKRWLPRKYTNMIWPLK